MTLTFDFEGHKLFLMGEYFSVHMNCELGKCKWEQQFVGYHNLNASGYELDLLR